MSPTIIATVSLGLLVQGKVSIIQSHDSFCLLYLKVSGTNKKYDISSTTKVETNIAAELQKSVTCVSIVEKYYLHHMHHGATHQVSEMSPHNLMLYAVLWLGVTLVLQRQIEHVELMLICFLNLSSFTISHCVCLYVNDFGRIKLWAISYQVIFSSHYNNFSLS